jgi:hypothetical protein
VLASDHRLRIMQRESTREDFPTRRERGQHSDAPQCGGITRLRSVQE